MMRMLFQYLKKKMEKFPEKTLSDGERTVTYREILYDAERLAPFIKCRKIGILCRSELNAAAAVLAAAAAGAAAVPMSYQYGVKLIDRIISHTGLSFLLVDDAGFLQIKQIRRNTPEKESLGDAAFILCTSGTTGNPKGAVMSARGIVSNLEAISAYFDVNENDRIMIIRPLYHCAVLVGEYLTALTKGLDIVFLNNGFNPVKTAAAVKEWNISVMCGTPTLFYHILNAAKRNPEPLALRTIAVSGECMKESAAEIMLSCLPETRIFNVYGLTEAGPRVSYLPPEMFKEHFSSVGMPLDGTSVKVENGELLVQSESLMLGYYGDSEQTQKALRGGWLHTGDMAEIRDGLIYILGRKDDLIIRGGMNIYPLEIENALRKDPRISDALAYGISDGAVTQRIGLMAEAQGIELEELVKICRKLLPSYQYPDEISLVDELPRNASGKVQRRRDLKRQI